MINPTQIYYLQIIQKTRRGGHLGHAMVEYEPGKILCFYANCNGEPNNGHSGDGWMEFKRSLDGGKTWSEKEFFPYSKALYDLNIGIFAMCEKAVTAPNGDIIVFNLICDLIDSHGGAWEPYGIPTYVISHDKAKTWDKAVQIGDERGRVYDACVKDGRIYVLLEYGAKYYRTVTEYHIFVSDDNGKTFNDLSCLPLFSTVKWGRLYGTMEWLNDGGLIVYSYREEPNEYYCDYTISYDGGKTWSGIKQAYFKHRIRNMQLVKFKNTYFMFGRSGTFGDDGQQGEYVNGNIIVYCSPDAVSWDEGHYLKMREHGIGAYSNTLVVTGTNGHERLLYQASHAYDQNRTNVYHWWIDYTEK